MPARQTTAATTTTTTASDGGTEAEGDVDTEVVENTETPDYGGTVTIGLEAEAVGPAAVGGRLFLALLQHDDRHLRQVDGADTKDGTVEPFLAESVSANEDFTVFTMTLRPGVTFHNGTALTAQTIADMFPIQQAGAASAGAVSSSEAHLGRGDR